MCCKDFKTFFNVCIPQLLNSFAVNHRTSGMQKRTIVSGRLLIFHPIINNYHFLYFSILETTRKHRALACLNPAPFGKNCAHLCIVFSLFNAAFYLLSIHASLGRTSVSKNNTISRYEYHPTLSPPRMVALTYISRTQTMAASISHRSNRCRNISTLPNIKRPDQMVKLR